MKDKIINITLLAVLFLLILSIFSWNENNNNQSNHLKTWLEISMKNTFTIPAWVKFDIINYNKEDFSFNTCEDISIRNITWNIDLLEDCRDLTIKYLEKQSVDLSKNYYLFEESWQYILEIDEISKTFNINDKWFFNKIFSYFFYWPVYNLVAVLLLITSYSLWWAIIIVTIIIRIILLRPQHKMMISQRKLQQIQPKIKEIQEKYKGNHQALWMELMSLYKKEKVNPMWSCGLLLIQMPILIVIYHIIITIQNHQNMYYLYSFVPEFQVDNISYLFYWLDLLWIWWWNWFFLAIIVWLIQYLQIKLSLSYNKNSTIDKKKPILEKKKWAKDYNDFMPDPEFINKFMLYWIPIMIAIFTFSFYAWVWLYWWVWTLFILFQQLFVNKIMNKK